MENKIKIGDKTFEFNIPDVINKSTTDMMNDWIRLIEKQKHNKDIWTVLPELPQYKFKNLRVELNQFGTYDNELEMILECDDIKDIENND